MLKKWIIPLAVSLFSLNAKAAVIDFFVSGGAAFSSLTNNQTVTINDNVTNYYVSNNGNSTGPFGGFGIGHTFEKMRDMPVSVMIAMTTGYYAGFEEVSGIEYPMINDDVYDTLNYQFKAESFAAFAEARIFADKWRIRPFVLAGAGASWNHLFDYNETPTNASESAAPIPIQYKNNVTTSFAYEAGAGVQALLFDDTQHSVRWYASIEYRYMNLGTGKLTAFPALTSGDTLEVSGMSMQAALFTLQVSLC